MAVVSWWQEAVDALGAEPFLRTMAQKSAPAGLAVCEDLFATYIRAVCGQQVSTVVAQKISGAVLDFAGSSSPAHAIASAGVEKLRSLGLSNAKAQALSAIARRYEDGALTAETLTGLEDDAVRERLTEIKGVGPWTADMVLIFGLNRPDVWAGRDYGLRKAIDAAGFADVDSLRWAPWRTAATWLFWRSLPNSAIVQY